MLCLVEKDSTEGIYRLKPQKGLFGAVLGRELFQLRWHHPHHLQVSAYSLASGCTLVSGSHDYIMDYLISMAAMS